jgi:Rps23 Pro-64 3,4-dihydroxylase Tpa1-like proline 4-hydroxylase
MNVQIYDNKINNDVLLTAISATELSNNFSCLHPAGDTTYGFKYHWTLFGEYGEKKTEFKDQEFINLLNEIKPYVPENLTLTRAYINAHNFGIEDTMHTDEQEYAEGVTVIVYLCSKWYPEWFGQTVLFDRYNREDADISCSILPKYNRFIVFDKNIPHCAAPLSKRFNGVRFTCMFKFVKQDIT